MEAQGDGADGRGRRVGEAEQALAVRCELHLDAWRCRGGKDHAQGDRDAHREQFQCGDPGEHGQPRTGERVDDALSHHPGDHAQGHQDEELGDDDLPVAGGEELINGVQTGVRVADPADGNQHEGDQRDARELLHRSLDGHVLAHSVQGESEQAANPQEGSQHVGDAARQCHRMIAEPGSMTPERRQCRCEQ